MERVLYRTLSGSHLYGLADEHSDIDREGVYFPSIDNLLGIRALINAKHEKHGIDDTMMFSLAQYAKLIVNSNFKALEMLFAPEEVIEVCHPLFREAFVDQRDRFISQRVLAPLLGFATSNFNSIDKVPNIGTNRFKWYQKLGYDSKYLMHTARIMMVGVHLINTGEFKVNWNDRRDYLLGIKTGEVPKSKALAEIERDRAIVRKAIEECEVEVREELYSYANNKVVEIGLILLKEH